MRCLTSRLCVSGLLLLLPFLQLVHAARSTATSFCKCICFTNSTIIALNPPPQTTSTKHNNLFFARDAAPADGEDNKAPPNTHHKLTCADCTRAFCLDHRLPICKNAKEEDVFTTCFQRDSLKDETIVVLFLLITAGLLGWALIQPYVERFRSQKSFGSTPSQHEAMYSRSSRPGNARAASGGLPNVQSSARYSEDDGSR